jgi:hypothetical protein
MPTRPDTIDIYLRCVARLYQGGDLTATYIRDQYGVSKATAHRYLLRIEASLPVHTEEFWTWGPEPSLRLTLPKAALC